MGLDLSWTNIVAFAAALPAPLLWGYPCEHESGAGETNLYFFFYPWKKGLAAAPLTCNLF